LYLSQFSDKLHRPTVETALIRNRFMAALADKILVPYAAPGSKTLELCRLLLSWNKSVYTLANHANAPLIDLGASSIGD
jgi:predicted Rossmann fold nucleotide-binding protein DprA/Smf involved in DNA uptake